MNPVPITFSRDEYCLVDEAIGGEHTLSLNYLIDRSYKGKDFDVGEVKMYLTEEEYETFEKAGFSSIELWK